MLGNICFFTGHRKIPFEARAEIQDKLEILVEKLITTYNVKHFISGGAYGFDAMGELAFGHMKEKYPYIYLTVALPYKNNSIHIYANNIIEVSEKYFNGCMHKRNRYMADRSNFCIAYLTEQTGGTFYTVNYALKRGMTVIRIT